jgi:hypothetical protein
MLINDDEYKQNFQGFQIIDCVVRKKDVFYIVAKQTYDTEKSPPSEFKLKKAIISFFLHDPVGERWSSTVLGSLDHLLAGFTMHQLEQFVGVDMSGNVYAIGSGEEDLENSLVAWSDNGPQRGGICKLRTIDEYVYAIGGNRTVLRRDDKNRWHGFTYDIPNNNSDLGNGFADIDGFSANDIYCVGGKGDVWHFNGEKWKQLAFPSNMYLESVCCAGDGYVYIGGQQGNVFKGKGDSWKKIHKGELNLPFKDMVWHQGKVWCTSDYGLWEIENDKLTKSGAPDEVRACAGNLSVGDGVMLLAGIFGAAFHDGKDWQILVDTLSFEKNA